LLISFNASAFDTAIFQYAGDIGKYSLGAGKQVNEYYSLSLHYGFTPANGIQDKIETYTFKNNLHLYEYEYKNVEYSLYTGLSVYYFPSDKYKTNDISGPASDYYRQSQVRSQIYIGHQLTINRKHAIYIESGINDIWIINSYNNESVDYKDHIVMGLGYKYTF
jgi:hypothetical protein